MINSRADRRSPLGLFPGQPTPRLYDRVVEILRTRHYIRRTEQPYLHWIRRFILLHVRTCPRQLAEGRRQGHDGLHTRIEPRRPIGAQSPRQAA